MKVFVDGENFRRQLISFLESKKIIPNKETYFKIDLRSLLEDILEDVNLEICYYTSRLKMPKNMEISSQMQNVANGISISKRKWTSMIASQNIRLINAGNLKLRRAYECRNCGHIQDGLQEKGVDVRIALDILETAHNNPNTVFGTFSSDTDLCPAYHKAKAYDCAATYICFETMISYGVSAEAGKTVIITEDKVRQYITIDI